MKVAAPTTQFPHAPLQVPAEKQLLAATTAYSVTFAQQQTRSVSKSASRSASKAAEPLPSFWRVLFYPVFQVLDFLRPSSGRSARTYRSRQSASAKKTATKSTKSHKSAQKSGQPLVRQKPTLQIDAHAKVSPAQKRWLEDLMPRLQQYFAGPAIMQPSIQVVSTRGKQAQPSANEAAITQAQPVASVTYDPYSHTIRLNEDVLRQKVEDDPVGLTYLLAMAFSQARDQQRIESTLSLAEQRQVINDALASQYMLDRPLWQIQRVGTNEKRYEMELKGVPALRIPENMKTPLDKLIRQVLANPQAVVDDPKALNDPSVFRPVSIKQSVIDKVITPLVKQASEFQQQFHPSQSGQYKPASESGQTKGSFHSVAFGQRHDQTVAPAFGSIRGMGQRALNSLKDFALDGFGAGWYVRTFFMMPPSPPRPYTPTPLRPSGTTTVNYRPPKPLYDPSYKMNYRGKGAKAIKQTLEGIIHQQQWLLGKTAQLQIEQYDGQVQLYPQAASAKPSGQRTKAQIEEAKLALRRRVASAPALLMSAMASSAPVSITALMQLSQPMQQYHRQQALTFVEKQAQQGKFKEGAMRRVRNFREVDELTEQFVTELRGFLTETEPKAITQHQRQLSRIQKETEVFLKRHHQDAALSKEVKTMASLIRSGEMKALLGL